MKFNQLILKKLQVIIDQYDLDITIEQDDYLELRSTYLIIIIVHNVLENSNTVWMGRNDGKTDKVEIDNSALELFFNSNLKLNGVPIEVFADNLLKLLLNEAESLLMGDLKRIDELEMFDLARSQKYTQDLIAHQHLQSINKAWDEGNYEEFIKLIDQTNKSQLSHSYLLKYKIANQKLHN